MLTSTYEQVGRDTGFTGVAGWMKILKQKVVLMFLFRFYFVEQASFHLKYSHVVSKKLTQIIFFQSFKAGYRVRWIMKNAPGFLNCPCGIHNSEF